MLVCDVVLNRVDSEDFPNTITEVITQKGQFATYPNAIKRVEVSNTTKEIVSNELTLRLDTTVIAFRTGHFHKNSNWEDYEKVGDHYFSQEVQ